MPVPTGRQTLIYFCGDQFKQAFQAGVEAMQIECGGSQEVIPVLYLLGCLG